MGGTPASSDQVYVIAPSKHVFITGIAKQYKTKYDKESPVLKDRLSKQEFKEMMMVINQTL